LGKNFKSFRRVFSCALDGFEDLVVEDVYADEGLIADRLLGLLDESVDGFVFVEDDDTISAGVGDICGAYDSVAIRFVNLGALV